MTEMKPSRPCAKPEGTLAGALCSRNQSGGRGPPFPSNPSASSELHIPEPLSGNDRGKGAHRYVEHAVVYLF